MLRVGLLGAGFIGRAHLAALEQLDDVEVVAIATARSAVEPQYRHYPDPAQLVAAADIDAVVIALPTDLHARYAVEALQNGKSVLVEKPMARTLDEIEQIREATTSGPVLMAAHVVRHKPEMAALRRIVGNGDLGSIIGAHSHRLSSTPRWSQWLTEPKRSGGALLDLLTHDLDVMNWLLGRPASVVATGHRGQKGGWDYVEASLRFDDSPHVAHVHGSNLLPDAYPFSAGLQIVGQAAAVELRERHDGPQIDGEEAVSLNFYEKDRAKVIDTGHSKDPFLIQAEAFVAAATTGQTPEGFGIDDAAEALQLAVAIERSLEEGTEVNLADLAQ